MRWRRWQLCLELSTLVRKLVDVVRRNEMEKMTIMFGIVYTSSQTIDVVGRNEMEKMTIMFGIVSTSVQTSMNSISFSM
jgi:hypothetical protein